MIFALVFLTILCLSFLAGVIRISCSYGELLGPLGGWQCSDVAMYLAVEGHCLKDRLVHTAQELELKERGVQAHGSQSVNLATEDDPAGQFDLEFLLGLEQPHLGPMFCAEAFHEGRSNGPPDAQFNLQIRRDALDICQPLAVLTAHGEFGQLGIATREANLKADMCHCAEPLAG